MTVIERLSTEQFAQAERLERWNRIASETFSGLLVDSEKETFNAEMLRWSIGDLTLIRPRSPAASVQRNPRIARDSGDKVILHFQHAGRCHHSQSKHEFDMPAGDFVLADCNLPYCVEFDEFNEMLVAEMPRAAIADRLPELDDYLSRRIPGATASGRLLHDFLLSLWRQGDRTALDPSWSDGVANVFLDLLALAIKSRDAAPTHDRGLADMAVAIVETQLCDPDLRPSTIAAELGVSIRTVQSLFSSRGATPSGFILDRRLERAAERLASDRAASITKVAFELGFNDCGYFTRCFRQKFGIAPSIFRSKLS